MFKFEISPKLLNLSLFFGVLCAVFLSLADFNASCEELRTNVLRLHIIANSDSAEDQQLKLRIRDAVLEKSEDLFDNINNAENALLIAEQNTQLFLRTANEVIEQNGFGYKAEAYIGDRYFETREYENFTLPAGYYKSLIINVGKASGKNWWCVIFPEVCLPAASAELSDAVSSQSADVAEQSQRYIMRFKTVEIYEKIKNLIK